MGVSRGRAVLHRLVLQSGFPAEHLLGSIWQVSGLRASGTVTRIMPMSWGGCSPGRTGSLPVSRHCPGWPTAPTAYQWLGDNALVKLHRSVGNVLARYPVATEEAWLDIRFPPEDADFNGKSAAEIAACLAACCEPGVTPEVDHADPPHRAGQDRPRSAACSRPRATRVIAAASCASTARAARFYYQRGIDAVAFGIGDDGQHGPSEYADTTTIAPYYRALREFLDDPGERPARLP
jgi:hypothetical protein